MNIFFKKTKPRYLGQVASESICMKDYSDLLSANRKKVIFDDDKTDLLSANRKKVIFHDDKTDLLSANRW